MKDFLSDWRELVRAEAAAAAEQVFRSAAGALVADRERATALMDSAAAILARADELRALTESLAEILKRAPREQFLADATVAILVDGLNVHPQADVVHSSADARAVMRELDSHRRAGGILIQRNAAPLPAGRYAVVISFHRIDGGDAK